MRTPRELWEGNARPFECVLGTSRVVVDPKSFSTGSCGYYGSGKISIPHDGEEVRVQWQLTMTVIGSKKSAQPKEALAGPPRAEVDMAWLDTLEVEIVAPEALAGPETAMPAVEASKPRRKKRRRSTVPRSEEGTTN